MIIHQNILSSGMVEQSINGKTQLFLSMDSANCHSSHELKQHICKSYRNYVLHKKQLFEFGDGSFYRRKKKIESLDKCLAYIDVLPSYKLIGICKIILKLKQPLEHILPSPSNASYVNQQKNLHKMICLSENLLRNHL